MHARMDLEVRDIAKRFGIADGIAGFGEVMRVRNSE